MMQRREFLARLVRTGMAGGAYALTARRSLAADQPAGTLRRASVTDFGADATGQKDSTEAVQRAVAALTRRNARLVFPAGKYMFAASDQVVMAFRNFEGLEVFGNGAELFFDGATRPLHVVDCRDLEIHDIVIDWTRPPVSQGIVRTAGDHSLTVEVDPSFTVTGAEKIEGLIGIDDKGKQLAADGVRMERGLGAVQLRSPQTLEIALTQPSPFATGARVALLHAFGEHAAVRLEGCEQVLLETVVLHAAPSSAISMAGCRDITLDTIGIFPHPGTARFISANGSGVDMLDCTGTVGVQHARLGGTVGAAMRMQQSYWRIVDTSVPQVATVASADGEPVPAWALPRPGSYLQLSEAGTLKLLGEIAVTKAEAAPGGMKLMFEETLSPSAGKGTLVCLSATNQPRLKMDDCRFLGGASTGLVVQSRGRVQGTSFADYPQAAILMAPDLEHMRGPVIESMHVTDCTFTRCGLGNGDAMLGAITIDTAAHREQPETPASRINEGITLQRNTFSKLGGPAIYCAGASWLDVEFNHFNDCDQRHPAGKTPRAVVLRNLTDSTIATNDAKAEASIVMIACTDKVKAVDNSTLTVVKG